MSRMMILSARKGSLDGDLFERERTLTETEERTCGLNRR